MDNTGPLSKTGKISKNKLTPNFSAFSKLANSPYLLPQETSTQRQATIYLRADSQTGNCTERNYSLQECTQLI